ncbi:MAG TPA: dTDP-4-dehydrorhamnose reductase, partial [Verrucomicrobiae bacterium]|nr:dTDP-4-dehydrorhamnose reductase [Verrucomicrobiae bacterium]
AGFTARPNIDACETARAETLAGNTLLPVTVANACLAANVPWGHLSSGCIYSGAYVENRIETNLSQPHLKNLAESSPELFRGFKETDEPNFSFRHPPCSFYSGSKALAEEAIAGLGQNYIWRVRLPFDHLDNPRNYITKLLRYPRLYDNVNSISHRLECVSACLDLWERRAPFGIYNLTNPGFLTTRQVAALMEKILQPARRFEFWADDAEFYRLGAKAPRSNCILDVSKLLGTGIKMRSGHEALVDALQHWKS